MVTSLSCGCELPRGIGTFDRLFGFSTLDRRRSRSATALRTPWHGRSAGGRRFPGRSQRCEAREATSWIEHDFMLFWNIQDAESAEITSPKLWLAEESSIKIEFGLFFSATSACSAVQLSI